MLAKQSIAIYQTVLVRYFVDGCRISVSITIYLPPQSYYKLTVWQHYFDQDAFKKDGIIDWKYRSQLTRFI